MSSTAQPVKLKRRWCRFSLKTLLVVMTVAIVAFGGWVQFMRKRAQVHRDRVAAAREAVTAIEELGGEFLNGYERFERRPQTWLEKQFNDPGGDDDPTSVLVLRDLSLTGTENTDAAMDHLKWLPNLYSLNLSGTRFDESLLKHLNGMPDIHMLFLEGTNISDAGLEHLKELPNLQYIDLENTPVTDDGFKKLQQALPNCEIVR